MTLNDLKEVKIDHLDLNDLSSRPISTSEEESLGIGISLGQFIWDFRYTVKRITRCWEYGDMDLIIELDNKRLMFYEFATTIFRVIRLFDGLSEPTEEQWKKTFGYNLSEAIWHSKMYQYEVAKASGISEVILSKYLTGKAIPKIHTAERLARTLNCSVDDFLPKDFYFV